MDTFLTGCWVTNTPEKIHQQNSVIWRRNTSKYTKFSLEKHGNGTTIQPTSSNSKSCLQSGPTSLCQRFLQWNGEVDTKIYRKRLEKTVTSDNKTSYVRHESTSVMNTRNIFQKELILLAFRRQNYYLRIKYIIFKSSSLKYNEVSSSNCQACRRGREMYKKEIKKGMGMLTFALWKRSMSIFLKNKNNRSPQSNLFQGK